MAKHTPGPWTTDYDKDECTIDFEGNIIACTNDRDYFSTGYTPSVCRANARLISKSPQLYALLKEAYATLQICVVESLPVMEETKALLAELEAE